MSWSREGLSIPATLLAKIDAPLIQGLAAGVNNCYGLKNSKQKKSGCRDPAFEGKTDGRRSVEMAFASWIADQVGHTNGNMIRKHYGTCINEDGPDVVGMLQLALKLSPVTALH